MPAARYWRLAGVSAVSGDLEISELHLRNAGGVVGSAAAFSSVLTPITGSVSNLRDNDLATVCRFAASALTAPGFAFEWDAGAGNTIDATGVVVGSSASVATFLAGAALLYRNAADERWVVLSDLGTTHWPGPNTPLVLPDTAGVVPTTLNTLDASDRLTLSNGDRTATANTSGYSSVRSVHSVMRGRYYVEAIAPSGLSMPGVAANNQPLTNYPGGTNSSIGLYQTQVYVGGAGGQTLSFDATAGVGMLIDADARTLRYRKGAVFGAPITIPWGGPIYIVTGSGSGGNGGSSTLNFGDAPFLYDVPDGYVPGFGQALFPPTVVLPTSRVSTPEVLANDPPDGPVLARGVSTLARLRDVYFDGRGFIAGTVKRDSDPTDVPLRRRVRLHRELDGLLVQETWSDVTTGAYVFTAIDETAKYTVITYDYEHNYRAVIADNIAPEIMT